MRNTIGYQTSASSGARKAHGARPTSGTAASRPRPRGGATPGPGNRPGRGRSGRFALLAAVALWSLLLGPGSAMGQTTPPTGAPPQPALFAPRLTSQEPGRRVLLLYTEPRLTPPIVSVDQAIRSTLQARSPVPVYFYTEFLDLNMFDGTGPQRRLRELLRRKYEARPIDLILAGGRLAVPIALDNRNALFSGAPVVFVAVDRSGPLPISGSRPPSQARGYAQGWAETLDLARRLPPRDAKGRRGRGSTPAERFYVWTARSAAVAIAGWGEIRPLLVNRLSLEQVLQEIAALPKGIGRPRGTVPARRDRARFATPWVISQITAVAGVPLFRLTEASIGAGVVGGHVLSFEAHGSVARRAGTRRPCRRAPGTDRHRHHGSHVRRSADQALGHRETSPFCLPRAWFGSGSRPSGSSIDGTLSRPAGSCLFRARSSQAFWCNGLAAAAPSRMSPTACGSRRSSRTSRPCCRPARARRSIGGWRQGSGVWSRPSGWIGLPYPGARGWLPRGSAHAFVGT